MTTHTPTPPLPDPIAQLPPKKGPGRGKRSMPSLQTAARVSVYTSPAGRAWLEAQAAAAGCGSIGQWADLCAMTLAPTPPDED